MCSRRSDARVSATRPGAGLLPALFFAALLAGCAAQPDLAGVRPAPELSATPFHPQERYQCGPAALLTVLEHSGAEASLDALVEQVYLPGARGSLQVELLAATRRAGRVPYVLPGTLAALAAEVAAGRPVLVMQNLGVRLIPRWHYAVVIAVDPAGGRVVLRSGTERRRVTPLGLFARTWARSGNWAFVALGPGELPATLERERYYDALAGVEESGRPALALPGWQAALTQWPGDAVAQFGLGNARLALGDWRAAEHAYRELLAARPALAPARNNLALALLEQGRLAVAEAEAQQALADADPGSALAAEISDTLARIRAAREAQSSRSGSPSSTSR